MTRNEAIEQLKLIKYNLEHYGNPNAAKKLVEFRFRSIAALILILAELEVDNADDIKESEINQGEWIEAKYKGMSLYPDGQKMCSVCNQIMPYDWEIMPPYCYNCGAKMGEGVWITKTK